MKTVKDITFNLLRKLELTTIVGNPGSTEETFLKNFPKDFKYVMALQEASVVGVADGLAQGLRKPVIVNVHTSAGLGNAMGSIMTAYQNKTPLIITAGQQTREMLLLEPLLTNIESINMPRPWVKWSYEPARPEDIPGAFMRAYATAVQQPSGPVFLSLPLDDWDKKMVETDVFRTVATRVGPDPVRLQEFANIINSSHNPVLVYGSDIARSQAWYEGIKFAEIINAKVWAAPFAERTPFPENHDLYAGSLPAAIGPLAEQLTGHDLVIVIGAPVFRYYPFVPGQFLPTGVNLLHITDDPNMSSKAPVGHSLVSDSLLFLESIIPLINNRSQASKVFAKKTNIQPDFNTLPLSPDAVFATLSPLCPEEFILVEESPSNVTELRRRIKTNKPDSFYTFASGGLGWDMPAAVGLAIAEKRTNRNRPVIAVIGDGSFQYCVQSIYTGVQQNAHVIFIVLRNEEYAVLKEFAVLEKTPNVPWLDLPGINITSLGKGYGAAVANASTKQEIESAFKEALKFKGTSIIEIPITKGLRPLLD